jgi:thiamine-phosphate pyrophosphorylase
VRRPVLCLVTDRRLAAVPLEDAVGAAVAAGVDWVQVRERDLGGADLVALCDRIVAAARAANPDVRVLVNRRIDVALAVGADGAHLGFDALPVAAARALLGDAVTLGVATHAPEEVEAAARDGADYAHLAAIFAPLSKPATRAPLGLDAIARCRGTLPLIAQGGIDPHNATAVVRAGAAGVAVTGAILGARDPAAAARALRVALDAAVG